MQVRQLHKVSKVLDGAVAAPLVQVSDEGRAVGWDQHGGIAANLDVADRVAAVLGVGGRCRALDDLAAHATRKPHSLAIHVRAGVGQQG